VSREWGIRLFCGLIGAAIGAAASDVTWTWWAAWTVAAGTWVLVATWHRNGGPTHA
jgi:hypothetical protein